MKLSDLRSTIQSLDSAYPQIASEYEASSGRSATKVASGFPYQGLAPIAPDTEGTSVCDLHPAGTHGLSSDGFSSAIAQELTTWAGLAQYSDTARQLLGIRSIDPSQGDASRLGTMVTYTGDPGNGDGVDNEDNFDVQLAASGNDVEPVDGTSLWAPANQPDGTTTGEYPAQKLLANDRAPMGYAESWLSAHRADGGFQSFWPETSRGAQDGITKWACKPQTQAAALPASVNDDYGRAAQSWTDFLRNGGASNRNAAFPVAMAALGTVGDLADGGTPEVSRAPLGSPAQEAEARSASVQRAPALQGPQNQLGSVDPGMVKSPEQAAVGRGMAQTEAEKRLQMPGARDLPKPTANQINQNILPNNQPAQPMVLREKPGAGPSPYSPRGRGGTYLDEPGNGEREAVSVYLESNDFDCNEIEVREMNGTEAVSQLFSFDVLAVCPVELELDASLIVCSSVDLVFRRGNSEIRRVHGMVAQLDDMQETESKARTYRFEIVPRAWRSTLVSTQEVFLDTNVPDLIKSKLSMVGLDDAQMKVTSTYPVRELIVQYKETDLAFYSRLAEHLGISFYFDHSGDADKITFCDDNSAFPIGPDVAFHKRGEELGIFSIQLTSRGFPARYVEMDYNYRIPTIDLTTSADAPTGHGGGVVEYGGHYKTPVEGTNLAQIRAQEQAVLNTYAIAKSSAGELGAGVRFTMTDHPRLGDRDFLVVEIEHHVVQTTKLFSGGFEPYRNELRLVDATLPFRPARVTPRPRINGVVTAVVEPDPSGMVAESAVLDEQGRYTVLFYFDASTIAGKPKHSRPVRMMQPHAGPNYGMHFPLKPGVEVLISFVDGDPDRPVIAGSMPNPISPTPVDNTVNLMNRIQTTSGLIIEMRDAVPPLGKQ